MFCVNLGGNSSPISYYLQFKASQRIRLPKKEEKNGRKPAYIQKDHSDSCWQNLCRFGMLMS